MGVAFVEDCFGWYPDLGIDTSMIATMIDGPADRTPNQPMTRQHKGAWDGPAGWTEDMMFLAQELDIDACIYSGNLASKQTWGCLRLITDRLKEEMGYRLCARKRLYWTRGGDTRLCCQGARPRSSSPR